MDWIPLEFLNRRVQRDSLPPAEIEQYINCEIPTEEETRKVIKHLKEGKAAGPDDILAGVINVNTNKSAELLLAVWKIEDITENW